MLPLMDILLHMNQEYQQDNDSSQFDTEKYERGSIWFCHRIFPQFEYLISLLMICLSFSFVLRELLKLEGLLGNKQ